MIRTCRLFFPTRNSYNMSLFNQRTGQRKQILMEFSFYADQRKDHLQKKPLQKVEFCTFKEQGKIEQEGNSENKSKGHIPSDCATDDANDVSQKTTITSLGQLAQEMNFELPTVRKNIKSTSDDNSVRKNSKTHKEDENRTKLDITNGKFEVQPSVKSTEFYVQKNLSPTEIIKLFQVMVKTGNRSPTNLKSCSEALMSKETSLSLNEASNVLYCCARLSYANLPLLNFLSNHILSGLEGENVIVPKELVSLLRSVCTLKFRNCELIETLCKKLSHIDDLLTIEQTTLCLFALSNVNIRLECVDHFIHVLSQLNNTDFGNTKSFLNYIWASVILGKEKSLPLKHLELVLSKSFIEKLNVSGENSLLNKIKLSNISGVASGMENYKGPLLENLFLSPVLSKSKNSFITTVKDSLSYIFPKTGFMETLAYAGSGVFIDIECCLDSSSNPILLKSKEMYNKVGMILLDYSDFCLDNNEITGVTAFKIERIKKQNYKILTIPYSEFPFQCSLSQKIAYLRNKFRKVIHEEPNK